MAGQNVKNVLKIKGNGKGSWSNMEIISPLDNENGKIVLMDVPRHYAKFLREGYEGILKKGFHLKGLGNHL